MIGVLIKLMMTRGLMTKRWNNFPRIEDVSLLDNVGYCLHIALFLANIEEQKGHQVDRVFLIKKIIFESFQTLILSDINSGTRKAMYQKDPEIFQELEDKVWNYLFSLEAPGYIIEDMKQIVSDASKKRESDIIQASKKYAGYRECLVNARVFEEMYELPLQEIQKSFDEYSSRLESFQILLSTPSYGSYLSHIRRLSHSFRWNQNSRMFPISVMSHLVFTTFLSYVIAMIENHENNKKFSMENMLLKGLFHDIPEAITGDIITPTKRAVTGFAEVLESVEKELLNQYLFSYVDESYKNFAFSYSLDPFSGEEGKYVKYADIVSSLFEAKVEVNFGNDHFLDMYRQIKKATNTKETKSMDYLLKHALDVFDHPSSTNIIL